MKQKVPEKKNKTDNNELITLKEYKILFDTINLGIVFQDKNTEVISANRAAEDILGFSITQMQGKVFPDPGWRLIHEDRSPFTAEDHPAVISLKTGKVVADIVMGVFNAVKGRNVWINMKTVPLFNKDEAEPYQVYTVFEEISGRKKPEDETDIYFASTKFIFCIVDKNNYFTRVNKNFEKTLGYSREELLSKQYIELVHPDDKDKIISAIENDLKKGNEIFDFDNRYRCKDGSYKWLRWSATPFLDLDLAYVVAFDITDRRDTEVEFREVEELHKTVMENIHDPVFITDDNGRFTFIGDAIQHSLGYTKKELFELRNIKNLINKNIFDLTKLVKSTQISNIETIILDKYGNKKIFLVAIKRVSIKNGTILYVCRDITERKKLENNKRIQEKMFLRHQRLLSLGELSASIAHEIRQPLQVIKVITDTIIYRHNGKNKLLKECSNNIKDLAKISNNIDRINNIITNLQNVIKRPEEKTNSIDVNEEIKKIVEIFDYKLKRNSINIVLELDKTIKNIMFSDSQFQQVFSNLIKNSIEAFNSSEKPEKRIVVKSVNQDDFVIIDIIDNATGVNDDVKEKVFDPIFSTKKSGESLGMGLFVVNNILVANNSSISFDNNDQGGATFKVILKSGED